MASPTLPTTFNQFREDVRRRVESMHAAIAAPDSTFPGYLFVERIDGRVDAAPYPVAGLSETGKEALARVVLPAAIRREPARRFCWVMPAWKGEASAGRECLVLIFGERGRCDAELADVMRFRSRPPRLANWVRAPSVSGIFVEPLLAALAANA